MSFARPFAYNTGSTISGTDQVGDLAIGVVPLDYPNDVGGVRWWNGPDEDLGYIIAQTVPAGDQPNPLNIPCYVGFYRSEQLTEASFVTLVNDLYDQSFTTGNQCETYLLTIDRWTSWGKYIEFTQTFNGGTAASQSVKDAWTLFRSLLIGTYTKFDFFSSTGLGYTGITDPVKVQILANALRTAGNGTAVSVQISGITWNVGCCSCTTTQSPVANAVEFANVALCSAGSTAAIRPFIGNQNWGGIGTTLNSPTQTLTLRFY